MLTAVLLLAGVFAAWIGIDWWLTRRDERLERGRAEWSAAGPNRSFHSTAWEDTVPPLEVQEPPRTDAAAAPERRRATV
jgi:hypothetical protein